MLVNISWYSSVPRYRRSIIDDTLPNIAALIRANAYSTASTYKPSEASSDRQTNRQTNGRTDGRRQCMRHTRDAKLRKDTILYLEIYIQRHYYTVFKQTTYSIPSDTLCSRVDSVADHSLGGQVLNPAGASFFAINLVIVIDVSDKAKFCKKRYRRYVRIDNIF